MKQQFSFFSFFILFFNYISFNNSIDLPSCLSSQLLIHDYSKQILSNGCSKPPYLKIEGEEDFTYCCDLHDTCYSICNIPKTYCDDDFEICLYKLCSIYSNNKEKCNHAANTYSLGTKVFGQVGYIESQQNYCKCINKDEYEENIINMIQSFNEKYVKNNNKHQKDQQKEQQHNEQQDNEQEESEKVIKELNIQELFQKYSKKYEKLYYDLHKKYLNAIGHIEGRKHKRNVPVVHSEL